MKTYRRLASDISPDLLDRRNCTRRAIGRAAGAGSY
jgi:hypothetical protein